MKNSIKAGIFCVAILVAPLLLTSLGIDFRSFDHEGYTRIVFESERSFAYAVQTHPDRLEVRLSGRAEFPAPTLPVARLAAAGAGDLRASRAARACSRSGSRARRR